MRKLTADEQQYILEMLKNRYDDLYRGQRDGSHDWASADEEMEKIRDCEAKLLGHRPKRAGYNYL